MTREDFRRELGDAVDSISGSPDPALPERVRAALVHAPEQRGPVWIAALAAAVIAVVLVGVLLVGNPLNRGPLVPGVVVHPTPTPCSPTCPLPVPTPSPSPTASPFVCITDQLIQTDPTAALTALIDAVRTGTHKGYDRITIEFKNGQPGHINAVPQANTKFVIDASGATVTTDLKTPTFPGILEARRVGDFEGTVQWALGLSSPACYQTTTLANPTRFIIDIQTN